MNAITRDGAERKMKVEDDGVVAAYRQVTHQAQLGVESWTV